MDYYLTNINANMMVTIAKTVARLILKCLRKFWKRVKKFQGNNKDNLRVTIALQYHPVVNLEHFVLTKLTEFPNSNLTLILCLNKANITYRKLWPVFELQIALN